MMFVFRFLFLIFSHLSFFPLIIAALLILQGCVPNKLNSDRKNSQRAHIESAEILYKKGLDNLKAANFHGASKKFQAIDQQYPYSVHARNALLLDAFAHYREGKYDESISSARRYVQLYPTRKDSAAAQYLIGLSYFEQMRDVSRDQQPAHHMIESMQELVTRWPDSYYISDAKIKISFARNQIAGQEMHVGRYYLQRRDYLSAIGRFSYTLQKYSETQHAEEAIARLAEAYYAMGIISEAKVHILLLERKYPHSPWLKRISRLKSNVLSSTIPPS